MNTFTNIFVSLFYFGYFKKWPGTVASIVSIIIIFPIIEFNIVSKIILIIFFIITFTLSLFLINKYSINNKSHDSKEIVIDEFLGVLLIFIFYEHIYYVNTIVTLLLIFFLFRFFDILKIFPANIIDKKMKNSFGVILDDIVASIYTIFVLYLINVYN